MTPKEINTFTKLLRKKAVDFKANPQEAKDFLVRAGISTPKGKFTKAYKNLCIQPDQA
ncbi:MAG: hypothetical protein ACK4WD_02410 [Flavobacteriales bacterium]|jgi:hypothetical protein